MSTREEALEAALIEARKCLHWLNSDGLHLLASDQVETKRVWCVVSAALAQPVQPAPEPVAWRIFGGRDGERPGWSFSEREMPNGLPLYAEPLPAESNTQGHQAQAVAEFPDAADDALESIGMWLTMMEAERELAGECVIPDGAVWLSFMGSGASHRVTYGQLRSLLRAEREASPQSTPTLIRVEKVGDINLSTEAVVDGTFLYTVWSFDGEPLAKGPDTATWTWMRSSPRSARSDEQKGSSDTLWNRKPEA